MISYYADVKNKNKTNHHHPPKKPKQKNKKPQKTENSLHNHVIGYSMHQLWQKKYEKFLFCSATT